MVQLIVIVLVAICDSLTSDISGGVESAEASFSVSSVWPPSIVTSQ